MLTTRALFDTTFLRQPNRNVKHYTANIHLFCPRNVMIGWEELPNKNFPIIFHPVFGKDEREGSSPSFFNVAEVETIERYLRKLLDENVRSSGLKRLTPEMIGVISPYKRQVRQEWNLSSIAPSVRKFDSVHFYDVYFYIYNKSLSNGIPIHLIPQENWMSARSCYQLSSYCHQASWPGVIPPTIRQRTWYASNHARYVSDPSSSLKFTVPHP